MLNIDANPQQWVTHEPTGCRFKIKPLDLRTNQALVKECRDAAGEQDAVQYNGRVVDAVVLDWEGVGAGGVLAAPTADNKRKLGERIPSLSGFLYQKATDVRMFLDEADAAKNA